MDEFIRHRPDIPVLLPGDPEFAEARRVFIVNESVTPLAIAQPRHAEDVCTIVKYCAEKDVPIVVRSGGNNLLGMSQVHDALTIDMRGISYCNVDKSSNTARIGGVILMQAIYDGLDKADRATAVGMLGMIGWAGWAMYGGYGPLMGKYGLGYQQIQGAQVVNAKGELVEANETLLKGIRGAGGSFGVIVEFTISVYPLKTVQMPFTTRLSGMIANSKRQIFAGFMAFRGTEVKQTIQHIFTELQKVWTEGMPPPLSLAPIYFHLGDGSLLLHFMWSDDDPVAAHKWIERVSSWGNLVSNDVKQTTFARATDDFKHFLPPGTPGPPNTISVRNLTPSVIEVMARNMANLSTIGCGFAIHVAPQLSKQNVAESVFGAGEAHMMIEILESAMTKEDMQIAREWAVKFHQELKETKENNVLDATYISLTPPGGNSLKKIYGKHYNTIVDLRKRMHAEHMFKLAVPFVYLE